MASKFSKLREMLSLPEPTATPEEQQGRLEALGQGLTFGFGDELGAKLQQALAGGDPKVYHDALGENRDIYRRQEEREPVRTAALEVAGSIPGAILTPVGGAAGTAARDLGFISKLAGSAPVRMGIKEAMTAAIPMGAALGLGKSTADASTPEGMATQQIDMLKGAAGGSLMAGGLRGASNLAMRVPAIKRIASGLQSRAIRQRAGAGNMDEGAGYAVKGPGGVLEVRGGIPGRGLNEPRSPTTQDKVDEFLAHGKASLDKSRAKALAAMGAPPQPKTVAERLRDLLGEED